MDSHLNAPYVVKCVKLILDDQLNGVCKLPEVLSYWVLSDVFDEAGSNNGNSWIALNNYIPFGRVFGLINYQGVRKATFNAFKLLHMTGTTRIALTGGTGDNDGVDGFATLNADSTVATVIMHNFYSALAQTAVDTVNLTVNGLSLPHGQVEVRHYRIDTTHSNAYGVWLKQGKPVTPTTAQWDEMKAASNLAEMYPAKTINHTGSAYAETFPLPRQAVSMLQFKSLSSTMVRSMEQRDKTVQFAFSNGVISLNGALSSEKLAVTIHRLDGTVIHSSTSLTGSVNLQSMAFPRGVYLIRASCCGQRFVTKYLQAR
jgi:hypothetical protein